MPAKIVLVLAFDGVQVLDVTGPFEVFDEANRFSARPEPYRVQCVGRDAGVVIASNGLGLVTGAACDGPVDTLVIPGGTPEVMASLATDPALMSWIDRTAGRARRVASVCTGVLLLAERGLLDGRRATTHWGAIDALRAAAPGAKVEADALYTRDGALCTSAGVTAGIDLALALVEEDLGRGVAAAIARNLVLYLRRPGNQSQYSEPLQAQTRARGRMAAIVDHVITSPAADLSVPTLAERACMSTRHFARAFRNATGETPARFVLESRLQAARFQLAESTRPVQTVAARCGFASADVLARRFRVRFGISPSEYRRAFGMPAEH